MLKIGTPAPDFDLPEPATNKQVKLGDFDGKPLLVVFSCNHCPYVLHILQSFTEFARIVQPQGLAVVMINANDVEAYPQDSPAKMIDLARSYDFDFAYLYDQSQRVASAYQAACTPDFFLFDDSHKLEYRGQYDAARPGNDEPVTGKDLKAAVQALLAHAAIPEPQVPSMGCNIKWRAGHSP